MTVKSWQHPLNIEISQLYGPSKSAKGTCAILAKYRDLKAIEKAKNQRLIQSESVYFDRPSETTVRSPPAASFSNARTWLSATSRTSTQELEPRSVSFGRGLVDVMMSHQTWREVFNDEIDVASWIGGCQCGGTIRGMN